MSHRCQLVSRRRHVYKQFPQLAEELAHSVRAHHAVLDGEIVCLAPDGRSKFHNLMFRRDWPYFVAFDPLSIDREDLRARPLVERKQRLRLVMPRIESRLMYLDHVDGRGVDLFREVCQRDREGIDRAERFTPRRSMTAPSRAARPVLSSELRKMGAVTGRCQLDGSSSL